MAGIEDLTPHREAILDAIAVVDACRRKDRMGAAVILKSYLGDGTAAQDVVDRDKLMSFINVLVSMAASQVEALDALSGTGTEALREFRASILATEGGER